MFLDYIALVSQNPFGLPVSMNTLVIIIFVIGMFVAGLAWLFTKMGEGFFDA